MLDDKLNVSGQHAGLEGWWFQALTRVGTRGGQSDQEFLIPPANGGGIHKDPFWRWEPGYVPKAHETFSVVVK